MNRLLIVVSLSLLALALLADQTNACPFCEVTSQTWSEDINASDCTVVARLEKHSNVFTPPPGFDPGLIDEDLEPSEFTVEIVLSGEQHVKTTNTVKAYFYGSAKKGDRFFLVGVDAPELVWGTPLKVSDRAIEYLQNLPKAPADGPERLAYFQPFLEHSDNHIASDAYDEFAKAPYEDVLAMRDQIDRQQILSLIGREDTPASRRGLYFTLLGVCSDERDIPFLEKVITTEELRRKSSMSAVIACYLKIKGPAGVDLVEDLFLKNKEADYSNTFSSIQALRFHATDLEVVPAKRIVQAFHQLLDRPRLADLVIPDLARFEDWSAMDRLVELFKASDAKTDWVRVPVVKYLKVCPLPAAKAHIEELRKIDPDAVERAQTVFPFGPPAPPSAT